MDALIVCIEMSAQQKGNHDQTENSQHLNLLHITDFRADLARWSSLGFRALILFYYSFEKRRVGKTGDLLTLCLSSGVWSAPQEPHYKNREDLWKDDNCFGSIMGQKEKCDIT